MLIPRFWSRADSRAVTPDGKTIQLRVWRGSRSSAEEARALANEAVERMAGRIRRGEGFPERYAYGDRPLREEVVLEVPADAGGDEPDAAVTRNSYGALVLNAARAFFIDVDVPPVDGPRAAASPAASLWSLADSLPLPAAVRGILDTFRPGPAAAPAAPADPAAAAL
ncbi:MAG TPA: hypothetical protein VHG91_05880, partial [Longimicrobium sp.]|nr:hypothetical protein [Longimicrobium sp.]